MNQANKLHTNKENNKKRWVHRTPLLDELLVLVELLEVISRNGLDGALGDINVLSVGNEAKLHVGASNVGELVRTRETLITLGIVVLQTNLKLYGLEEVALVLLRTLEDLLDGRSQ